jgi:hypothetical protein
VPSLSAVSDLPPPSSPGGPPPTSSGGSFGPPTGGPPPPPGWGAPPAGGEPPFSGQPVPVGQPPSGSGGNKTPLIIGGVAVLALLGIGAYFLTKDDGDEQVVTTTPEVTIPEISLPDLTIPDFTIPDLTLPDLTIPDITLPEITLPEITIPEITIPDFTIPDFTIPDFTIPGQADADQAEADMTVSEAWVIPDPDSGENDYEYGVILDNASTTEVYEYVEVQISFYDDAGRLVDSESQYFSSVLPGKNIATGYVYGAPAPISRMETEVVVDDFLTSTSAADAGTLTFDQLAVADADDYSFSVTGQLVSSFPEQLDNVLLTAVWRDAAGAVIDTETAYLDIVPPNTPTLFTIDVYSETLERVPPSEVFFTL